MKKLEDGSLEKNNFEKDDSEKSSSKSGGLEKNNSKKDNPEKDSPRKGSLTVYNADGSIKYSLSGKEIDEMLKRTDLREKAIKKAKKYYKDYKRKPIYKFWVFEDKKMIEFEQFKSIEYSGENNEHFSITTKTGETYRDDQGTLLAPIEIRNKKGKRIFEGDLIKDGWRIFYIYYNPNSSSFRAKPIDKEVIFGIVLDVETAYSLNVVGNIFESDKIVKDKNISWPVKF